MEEETLKKIEAIRSKCIEANESIKDLVFGCRIQISESGAYDILIKKTPEIYELRTTGVWHGGIDWKNIIGRKIGLADVLLAIRQWQDKWDKRSHNYSPENILAIVKLYNLLADDLTLQSKELIDFVYSLLVNQQ